MAQIIEKINAFQVAALRKHFTSDASESPQINTSISTCRRHKVVDVTVPDECAATGQSCKYAPDWMNGEMQCKYCGKPEAEKMLNFVIRRAKIRLVMKRLRDVKPGDLYVGRQNWTNFTTVRLVIGVHESAKKPGKLSLVYDIDRGSKYGKVRRWPDFYVIVVKEGVQL